MNIGTKIFVRYQNKYLMLKRSDNVSKFKGLWDLPGGKIDLNESIIDCAKRELKEETNIEIKDLSYLTSYDSFEYLDNQFEVTVFETEVNNINEIKISSEHSEYKWVNKNELLDYLASYRSYFNIYQLVNKLEYAIN